MRLTTHDRRPLQLVDSFAEGGEATIWSVQGHPEQAAKIYHRPSAEKERKLVAMLANPPRQGRHPSVAWPQALLYHGSGRFVGFTMPRVPDSVPLFHYYNPARRAGLPAVRQPYHPWPVVLNRVARNLSAAVAGVHARGHVIGDLNESNVLVNRLGLVTLVDTDSFQIREIGRPNGPMQRWRPGAAGQIHRNPVGKPEFTPPELQGVDFKSVDRSPEHDHFGLAVLIFYLLMAGRHPYAGVLAGEQPGERVDLYCLRRGIFPYDGDSRAEPPPGAPPFTWLPPVVRTAFLDAFVFGQDRPGRRPTAAQWRDALDAVAADFRSCPADEGHLYAGHLVHCPYCDPQRAVPQPSPGSRSPVLDWRKRARQRRRLWNGLRQGLDRAGATASRLAVAGQGAVHRSLRADPVAGLQRIGGRLRAGLASLGAFAALLLQWTVANGVGIALGAGLAWLTVRGAVWGGWAASGSLLAGVAGVFFGLGLGWPQWLVMGSGRTTGRIRAPLPGGTGPAWVGASALSAALVSAMAYSEPVAALLLPNSADLLRLADPAEPQVLAVGAVAGMLFGVTVGYLQAVLLARRLARAGDRRIWTLANGIGWSLAVDGWLIGQSDAVTGWGWPMDAALTGLVGAVAGALLTGTVLFWLLSGPYRRPTHPVHVLWRWHPVDALMTRLQAEGRRWLRMALLLVVILAAVQGSVYWIVAH